MGEEIWQCPFTDDVPLGVSDGKHELAFLKKIFIYIQKCTRTHKQMDKHDSPIDFIFPPGLFYLK